MDIKLYCPHLLALSSLLVLNAGSFSAIWILSLVYSVEPK